MVSFQTTKVDRYTGPTGYIVQATADLDDAPQIEEFLQKHVNGVGTIEVSLKKPSTKRTLTANAYLWALCDEIAKALNTDKEAVYKALIRRVGVFDYVLVKEQAEKRFIERWEGKGLGWFADEVVALDPERKTRQLMVFYGSSVYSKEEMARVISEAEEEARAVGVSTKKKQEVREMIAEWQ